MYLILIYIIIVFILIIFCKSVEGQELITKNISDNDLENSYENIYNEELDSDSIRKKNINISVEGKEIVLNIYLTDTVGKVKVMLSKYDNIKIPIDNMELIYNGLVLRDNYMFLNYGINDGDQIHVENNIQIISEYGKPDSKIFKMLYGEDKQTHVNPYENYLKEFLKFNKIKKKKSDKIYSHRLSKLLENKSESYLKPYNKYDYLDDNLNEKLKQDNDPEKVGPSPYIDSSDLYDRIIQTNVDTNITNDSDKKICYQRSSLNISNPKLIDDNISVNTIKHDKLYESRQNEYYEPYNKSYYDYMETEDKIYDYLYGNMANNSNPGSLNP